MNSNLDLAIKALAVLVAVITYLGSKHREMLMRRAELVRGYTNDLYSDAAVVDLFMEIDRNDIRDVPIAGSDREVVLIRLLDQMNAMGHNWNRGVLKLEDIFPTTLAYAVLRVWKNPIVQEYLRHIKKSDEENYVPGSGFLYFEKLAAAISSRIKREKLFRNIGSEVRNWRSWLGIEPVQDKESNGSAKKPSFSASESESIDRNKHDAPPT
ncbi:hypothetical protein [Lentzea cavernae]|uniref:DUF4760 domain-containing protein n=1 Tax=Lentzea cavernae TaxID=2020703 RepID=A0ABQ3N0S6_9PSEU|nr:hypothetical protein [Lentzea cavernae]GHH62533.1 hypothetical protein GCM10017774_90580 [Lentzea cavernae]